MTSQLIIYEIRAEYIVNRIYRNRLYLNIDSICLSCQSMNLHVYSASHFRV